MPAPRSLSRRSLSRLALVALLPAAAALSACASLSEEECLAANWRVIGFEDGVAGRGLDYIAQHREACAEVGVVPDLERWRIGREQGLLEYCTPDNAYRIGRRGGRINAVCPGRLEAAMRRPFDIGRQYYDIGREIDGLERDVRDAERRLAELAAPKNDAEAREARRLRREVRRLEDRIDDLERERRRYARWP